MFAAASVAALTSAILFYWYVNRHKPIKCILSEVRYALDMQAAGVAGLVDDWVNAGRNKTVLPDKRKKIAVVTGGARGIGAEVVRGLLKANMTVVIGVRKPQMAEKMADEMENGANLSAIELDLQSLGSVRRFARTVIDRYPDISLLVNNAGIMFGDFELTEDGIEKQLAVNYLGHFYLIHLLLPALRSGARVEEPSRIVNVTSCAHFPAKIYYEDINMKQHYDTTAAYAQSKLAQLMIARHIDSLMAKENTPIRCYSVHPGIVDTDLFEKTLFRKMFPWAMKLFFKTPEKGATSILYACFDQDILKNGGLYISNCLEGISNRFSKNLENQAKLFNVSCQMIGIQPNDFGKPIFSLNS